MSLSSRVITFLGAAFVFGLVAAGGRPGPFAGRVLAQEAPAASAGYTEGQAARGAELYEKQCSACHGVKLEGGLAPELAGDDFMKYWTTKTVGELVEQMLGTMPADDPGKLTKAQSADLAAYIFSKNKFPAGQSELPAEIEALKQIRIVKP
ncbi:MAG: c-type cytochrome [Vicinamibacterales bacterium]